MLAPCFAVQQGTSLAASRLRGPIQKHDVSTHAHAANRGGAAAAAVFAAPALSAIGSVVFSRRSATRGGSKQARAQVVRHVGPSMTSKVGVSMPFTEKWDPLNLGNTDAKMDRYTTVEIKHGRVAMIACVGYVMPELFCFPGCEEFGHGLAAFSTIPFFGWVQLFAFIGAHEVLVKPRADGYGPWDFGLGTELLDGISDEEFERRQTVERNNGRLAMIAIWGMIVQEIAFGKTPFQMQNSGGWLADRFFQYIPQCNALLSVDRTWC